jgi:hypothetical protein
MRQSLTIIFYVVLLSSVLTIPSAQAAASVSREEIALDSGWEFLRGDQPGADVQPPKIMHSRGAWTAIDLPHTFNASDATEASPYRGSGWYRRKVQVNQEAHRRTYIEFDGAALTAEVWLNGTRIGRHEGGFARFRFDLTDRIRDGANDLVVRVDNARQRDVAPLSGDYTLQGGLYRSVRLVSTLDLHADMLDYGSSGAMFRADNVSANVAGLHWTVRVANDRRSAARAIVTVRLRDAAGAVVATARRSVTVPAREVIPVDLDAELQAPHRWNGVMDPYMYRSEVQIVDAKAARRVRDDVAFQVGIRDVRIDPERGLLLNGKPTQVFGVNVHLTYAPGKGVAVSDADVDADYTILEDLGVTGLRFAHYQHGQHSYSLADRKGYLVWTEVPLTAEVDASPAFEQNIVQQARELVRQNINHPSVFVWGLGNEIYKVDGVSARILDIVQRVMHEEDTSRPTVYANCCVPIDGPQASHSDLLGSNVYFGWYDKVFADLGPWLAANHGLRPATPQAVSEYGAGASVLQQEDPPRRPTAASHWHPEQYQALYHEAAWPQIAAARWLWASFVWVGFDFPSYGRDEGDSRGINDKGLVTMDRRVKKDAFYWYRANWSPRPTVYITSRRQTQRQDANVEVKVYSNQDTVVLRVNGTDAGERRVGGHIARWSIRLARGVNHIEARSHATADTVEWEYVAPEAK